MDTQVHQPIVMPVINPIMIIQLIPIMHRRFSRRIVLNVIQQLPGNHLRGIMTASISLFIRAGIMVDGIPVQTVTQIHLIMHRIRAMPCAIKMIIIKMKIVIHAIQEVTDEK